MLPSRSQRVLGLILCEVRSQHVPHPGKDEPFYTTGTVHEIEAGPEC